MARFTFPPLAEVGPNGLHRLSADKLITASYDTSTGLATIDVGRFDPRITLKVVWEASTSTWASIKVDVPVAKPNAHLIGRANRLLGGLDAPRIETYNRGGNSPLNGKVVFRMPADPKPAPGVLFGAHLGGGAWTWDLISGGARTSTRPAPSAPVQTPTPPPAAPEPPKPPAPPEPVKPKPVGPIKVDAPKHDPLSVLRFPTKATTHDIIAPDEDRAILHAFMARHVDPAREGMSACLLTGPAGTGKTQMVDYLAAKHGFGVFDANAMGAVDLSDWAGRTVLDKDGGTRFAWTPLIEVIRADGPYANQVLAVKVDEFNRTPSTAASNFWLPVIEEGRIYVPEAGETIDVSRNVLFFFTVNEGAGYSGTVDIDTAVRDRMDANVRLEYLSQDDEVRLILDRLAKRTGITREQAQQVVTAATQVRSMAAQREVRSGISTRNILKAVEQTAYGLTLKQACRSVWVNAYPDEAQRERVTTAVNASIL